MESQLETMLKEFSPDVLKQLEEYVEAEIKQDKIALWEIFVKPHKANVWKRVLDILAQHANRMDMSFNVGKHKIRFILLAQEIGESNGAGTDSGTDEQ